MQELRLEPLEDEDLPLLRKWLFREHVAKWFERPQDWIHEAEQRRGAFSWLHHYIVLLGDEKIGFCQYYPYECSGETWHGTLPTRGTYSIDYMVGEPAYLRQGLGVKIVFALLERIEARQDARRVIAQPDEENAASCNTLRAAGFVYDKENRLYLYIFSQKPSE